MRTRLCTSANECVLVWENESSSSTTGVSSSLLPHSWLLRPPCVDKYRSPSRFLMLLIWLHTPPCVSLIHSPHHYCICTIVGCFLFFSNTRGHAFRLFTLLIHTVGDVRYMKWTRGSWLVGWIQSMIQKDLTKTKQIQKVKESNNNSMSASAYPNAQMQPQNSNQWNRLF